MASSADIAGAMAAIEARLKANWTQTAIIFDNENAPDPWPPVNEQQNPVPWVYCELLDTPSKIIAFGSPGDQTVMDTGLLKLTVMVQKGSGLDDGRAKATALGEIFRQQKFYDSDPTAYVRTGTPRVGRSSMVSEDGNWVGIDCTIPYEFYHQA